MKTHKDLDVWKESINFVVDIYNLIKLFPNEEKYILADQMKRAVISIPSNISEGASRNSIKEYIHFLYIAVGSSSEIETQLIIAQKLGFINDNKQYLDKIIKIRKMLFGLIKSQRKKLNFERK